MSYEWFNIFNRTEFLAKNIPSFEYTNILGNFGEITVMACFGVGLNVLCNDIFLPVRFNDENPWYDSGVGVLEDENNDIWIGLEVPE